MYKDGVMSTWSSRLRTLLPLFCMLKYINYNRKSSESEDRQILSLISQEDEAMALAKRLGLVIRRTISESKSAKIPGQRKGFKELMRVIKRGQCNAIICWKLDRLARNMAEGGELIELIQSGAIQEIVTPFKTYSQFDSAVLLAVEFGFANQYSIDLARNVKRGLEKKAKMGIPHGIAPFGYLNKKDGDKGERTWIVDTERFPIVEKLFKKVLEQTSSPTNVYFWWIKNYQPTTLKRKRMGGKKVAQSYFYEMMRNPIYAGFFFHDGVEYELHKSLPRAINKVQFLKIQRMFDSNNHLIQTRHTARYTGIIKAPDGGYIGPDYKFQLICDCKHKFAYLNRSACPKCNTAIKDMATPKHLLYTYYYNSPRKKRRLPIKLLNESKIDEVVRDFVSDFHLSERMKTLILEKIRKIDGEIQQDPVLPKERKENRIADLEKRKKSLRGLLVEGTISKSEYEQDIAEIDTEILDIQISLVENKLDRPVDILSRIVNLYDVMSGDAKEEKIELLEAMRSHLTWDEKTLEFTSPDWVLIVKEGLSMERKKNHRLTPEIPLDFKGRKGDFDKHFSYLSGRLLLGLTNIKKISN